MCALVGWVEFLRDATSRAALKVLVVGSRKSSTQPTTKMRVCTPIGRGNALRAHPVAVRVGPDAPSCFARCARFAGQVHCSVTHLVRRPVCLIGERDSI